MSCILPCLFFLRWSGRWYFWRHSGPLFVCSYNGILAMWESYASRSSRLWT